MVEKLFKVSSEALNEVKRILSQDAFARNGYTLREAKALGSKGKGHYLYIESNNEKFFKENPVKAEGVEEVKGKKEFDEIKAKLKEEEDSVAAGVALFDL